jgi:hypothetical protein
VLLVRRRSDGLWVPMISELAGRFPERSPAITVNKPKDDNARRRGAKLHVALEGMLQGKTA